MALTPSERREIEDRLDGHNDELTAIRAKLDSLARDVGSLTKRVRGAPPRSLGEADVRAELYDILVHVGPTNFAKLVIECLQQFKS